MIYNNNMSNYENLPKRPTKDDDEEEILRQMREFERADKTPSAEVITGRSSDLPFVDSSSIGKSESRRPKSKFLQTFRKFAEELGKIKFLKLFKTLYRICEL